MSHLSHKAQARRQVRVYALTVSDTRTEDTDTGGKAIRELCQEAGHLISGWRIVPDDPQGVRQAVAEVARQGGTDVIITTGGTGVSRRDNTYEAVSALIDKRLDGFGELFRMLSFQDIGPSAMLSRAVGGLSTELGLFLFALPGSEAAVRLALTRLLVPELPHLVFEARR